MIYLFKQLTCLLFLISKSFKKMNLIFYLLIDLRRHGQRILNLNKNVKNILDVTYSKHMPLLTLKNSSTLQQCCRADATIYVEPETIKRGDSIATISPVHCTVDTLNKILKLSQPFFHNFSSLTWLKVVTFVLIMKN